MSASIPSIPPDVTAAIAAQGIELDAGDADRLRAYLQALVDANERFNLTAVTEPGQMWVRHVQDSLTLVPFIASAEAKTVIDVGSGGGLPGMPLAIAMPDVHFTLLEATGKKAAFLGETAAALGLANVTVLHERAETAGQDHRTHRGRYDVAVSRAVGRLNVLAELTVPFVRDGGTVLCIKGDTAAVVGAVATQALSPLPALVVDQVRTPTGTVVVIEKVRATPRTYPRLPGEPKRKPIA